MRSTTADPAENGVSSYHADRETICDPLGVHADPSSSPTRRFGVGIDLPLSGHHPVATATAPAGDSASIWVGLTAKPSALELSSIIRIQATDLRDAQRQTMQIRRSEGQQGRDPAAVMVLVDVEVVIDHNSRSALDKWAELERASAGSHVSKSVLYVGTANGLAGMIADIYAADVADGVTLVPLMPGAFAHIVNSTLPLLQAQGFAFDADSRGLPSGSVLEQQDRHAVLDHLFRGAMYSAATQLDRCV